MLNSSAGEKVDAGMKAPGWLRALSVIFGILILIFAFAIVAFPPLGLYTLVIWTAITLIFAGLERITVGFAVPNLTGGLRALNVIIGILAVVLAFVALSYPGLTIDVQIILFAFSLLTNGIASVTLGGLAKMLPSAPKWVMALVGILAIIFAIVVLAVPGLGEATLVAVLALGLMMQGVDAIAVGVAGEQ